MTQEMLEIEVKNASAALHEFPRGAMGLTSDATKASPEWKAAKSRYELAFARLRSFNGAQRHKAARKAVYGR